MRKIMAGRSALVVLAVLAVGTVGTGCGEKKVDYVIDDEIQDDEGASLRERLDVPKHYTGEVTGVSQTTGLKSVQIDSDISVPDSDKMVSQPCAIPKATSEYKKKVCESFFDVSQGVYVLDEDKPYRGDVEREIEYYSKLSDMLPDDIQNDYYSGMVKSLRKQLDTASIKRTGAGDYTADDYVGYRGDMMYNITFSPKGVGFNIEYYPYSQLYSYRPMDGAVTLTCYGTYGQNFYGGNKAALSREDAVKKGMEFLSGCGISNVVDEDCTDLIWEYGDYNYDTISAENYGYAVKYRIAIDGEPVYNPFLSYLDIYSHSLDDMLGMEMTDMVELYIDDSGVIAGSCGNNYLPTGEKSAPRKLLSWDEILDKLPDAVNTIYTENKTSYSDLVFNDVRLTYYRIKTGASESGDEQYSYVPVWVFACCADYTMGKKDVSWSDLTPRDKEYPIHLIIIDAVTGEPVDIVMDEPADGAVG